MDELLLSDFQQTIATLRAKVARLVAENERYRNGLQGILLTAIDTPPDYRCGEVLGEIIDIVNSALQESTNEPTPVKTMTQHEWDLRHANPYDLGDPHQPKIKRVNR